MELEILEAVNLVRGLDVADNALGGRALVLLVEQGDGVLGGIGVVDVWPLVVAVRRVFLKPLVITAEVLEHLVVGPDGLRRVEPYGRTYGVSVGVLRLGNHALAVDVEREVLLEEVRREIERDRGALEVRGLKNTLLTSVADRAAVGEALVAARDSEVVVGTESHAVDLVLPVGVSVAEFLRHVRVLTKETLDESPELVAVQHVNSLLFGRDADVAGVGDHRALALDTLLSGDDDDAVRAAGTVDGRSRGILENREGLDILRIDHREGVGKALDARVVHGETVNDDERVVRSVERRAATDAYCGAAARSTTLAGHVDAGYLASDHVLSIGYQTFIFLIGLNGRDRACEVVLAGDAVAYDHHIFKLLRVALERDRHSFSGRNLNGRVTDEREDKRLPILGFDGEIAIEVGDGSERGTFNHDGNTRDRLLVGSIDNLTVGLKALSRDRDRGDEADEQQPELRSD